MAIEVAYETLEDVSVSVGHYVPYGERLRDGFEVVVRGTMMKL